MTLFPETTLISSKVTSFSTRVMLVLLYGIRMLSFVVPLVFLGIVSWGINSDAMYSMAHGSQQLRWNVVVVVALLFGSDTCSGVSLADPICRSGDQLATSIDGTEAGGWSAEIADLACQRGYRGPSLVVLNA